MSVHWSGYYSFGDIARTRKVYFFKCFGLEWVGFFVRIHDGSQQHRPRKRYASCVYTMSKLARQYWERNSVHSPSTMCCSWKDQWLQLDHRRTENWRAVAHIPKERWILYNAFVERNKNTKSHCEPVWQKSICNRVYCIHVQGYDSITFSFRSFSFLIGCGFYGPII